MTETGRPSEPTADSRGTTDPPNYIARSVMAVMRRTERSVSPWVQRMLQAQQPSDVQPGRSTSQQPSTASLRGTPFRAASNPVATSAAKALTLVNRVQRLGERADALRQNAGSRGTIAVDRFAASIVDRFPSVAAKYEPKPLTETKTIQRAEMPFSEGGGATETPGTSAATGLPGTWAAPQAPAPEPEVLPPVSYEGQSLVAMLDARRKAAMQKQGGAAPETVEQRLSPRQISRKAAGIAADRESKARPQKPVVRRSAIEEIPSTKEPARPVATPTDQPAPDASDSSKPKPPTAERPMIPRKIESHAEKPESSLQPEAPAAPVESVTEIQPATVQRKVEPPAAPQPKAPPEETPSEPSPTITPASPTVQRAPEPRPSPPQPVLQRSVEEPAQELLPTVQRLLEGQELALHPKPERTAPPAAASVVETPAVEPTIQRTPESAPLRIEPRRPPESPAARMSEQPDESKPAAPKAETAPAQPSPPLQQPVIQREMDELILRTPRPVVEQPTPEPSAPPLEALGEKVLARAQASEKLPLTTSRPSVQREVSTPVVKPGLRAPEAIVSRKVDEGAAEIVERGDIHEEQRPAAHADRAPKPPRPLAVRPAIQRMPSVEQTAVLPQVRAQVETETSEGPVRLAGAASPAIQRMPGSGALTLRSSRPAERETKPAARVEPKRAELPLAPAASRAPAQRVQRNEGEESTTAESTPTATEQQPAEETGKAPMSLNELARKVYPLLKRMLAIERERR
ncbi:MAG TPA: hypothetical protein VJL59_22410 [Anaerolineales bacterium]|nr:hypothetical protein [Anaerolineales bacterium]